MRHLLAMCSLSVLLLIFTSCHSAPASAPDSSANAASSKSTPTQSPNPAQPTAVASQDSSVQPKPRPARVPANNPQIAQLDLGSEGGTRDGSYAMWVHVSEAGKPVSKLPVFAYNSENHIAAAARTNADGDARLLVQVADYRIAASRGKLHAEQAVSYHPGNQFELHLTR